MFRSARVDDEVAENEVSYGGILEGFRDPHELAQRFPGTRNAYLSLLDHDEEFETFQSVEQFGELVQL